MRSARRLRERGLAGGVHPPVGAQPLDLGDVDRAPVAARLARAEALGVALVVDPVHDAVDPAEAQRLVDGLRPRHVVARRVLLVHPDPDLGRACRGWPRARRASRPRRRTRAGRSCGGGRGEHLGGGRAVVARDVEVGDRADRPRAEGHHEDVLRAGRARRRWARRARRRRGGRRRCCSPARRGRAARRRVAATASPITRALAWSSASRSTWCSSAYTPAAARMPAWRIAPPSIRR